MDAIEIVDLRRPSIQKMKLDLPTNILPEEDGDIYEDEESSGSFSPKIVLNEIKAQEVPIEVEP